MVSKQERSGFLSVLNFFFVVVMTSETSKDNEKNDPSYPFFIHLSSHPEMILVSKPLNGENYKTWSRSMKISLSAKNKLGFIDGSIKAPSQTTKPAKHALWK